MSTTFISKKGNYSTWPQGTTLKSLRRTGAVVKAKIEMIFAINLLGSQLGPFKNCVFAKAKEGNLAKENFALKKKGVIGSHFSQRETTWKPAA